ncbi:TnsD family Tn7-like transposition protein [Acidovorax sp. 100]|uniref:TnsD family Tn7-like transposition protein n=1 Tax=Acidovorax sp. 100 TaxID=2135635 RepID=UPI000EF97ADA
MAEPATYAWLYATTATGLAKGLAIWPKKPDASVSRRWDTRDRELADLVRVTALSFGRSRACAGAIKLHHLYQRIPELKAKLNTLDRLPLTRAVIFDVVGPRTGL